MGNECTNCSQTVCHGYAYKEEDNPYRILRDPLRNRQQMSNQIPILS